MAVERRAREPETDGDAEAEGAEAEGAEAEGAEGPGEETPDAKTKSGGARETLKSIVALVVVLLVVEGLVRVVFAVRHAMVDAVALPYVMGGDFGPQPPWIDDERMRVHDPELYWRGRPDFEQKYVNLFTAVESDDVRRAMLRRFNPAVPEALRQSPMWRVKLNHEGFRGDDVGKKEPGTLRVVCMGDSWTFGASVDQDATYPAQLERTLRDKHPGKRIEVINLGIIGHSSFQGVKLVDKALSLEPDVLVVGYAMNERHWAGYKSSDPVAAPKKPLLTHSVVYSLLKYWALSINWKPKPMGELLAWEAEQQRSLEAFEDESQLEDWMKQSLADYDENLSRIFAAARQRGVEPVLVYPEFWVEGPYGRAARRFAERERIPLVDVSRLLADARAREAYDLEGKLALHTSPSDAPISGDRVELVMRVRPGPRAAKRMYIAGPYPEWGTLEPNAVELYDDGTHGDEKAGDGVYSRSFSMPIGRPLYYVWTSSGEKGKWTGLDVPVLRRVEVPADWSRARFTAPIDTFGEMHLYGDPWHTDADGNGLVARDLARVVEGGAKAKAILGGR